VGSKVNYAVLQVALGLFGKATLECSWTRDCYSELVGRQEINLLGRVKLQQYSFE